MPRPTSTAVTAVDRGRRQLLIFESHALVANGLERVSDYQFVKRCWEREELEVMLAHHGFGTVRCFGAYDVNVEAGATDRIVSVAQLRSRDFRCGLSGDDRSMT